MTQRSTTNLIKLLDVAENQEDIAIAFQCGCWFEGTWANQHIYMPKDPSAVTRIGFEKFEGSIYCPEDHYVGQLNLSSLRRGTLASPTPDGE